ncbi:hypothetical protein IRJ14_19070, partial [Isoptericola sp. QY 916]|nr:hypothetical protein [Isoptericola sp. QY 916]
AALASWVVAGGGVGALPVPAAVVVAVTAVALGAGARVWSTPAAVEGDGGRAGGTVAERPAGV